MTPAFLNALAKTLGWEDGIPGPAGDIANHPDDTGGLTKWGITQKAYNVWRLTTWKPKQSVELMSPEEMREIYFADYWVPAGCEVLPERLGAAVFDMAVHSGVPAAKITLQRSLGVKADGIIGPKTIKAAQRASVLPFLQKRGAYMQDAIIARPSKIIFLENWINRLLDQAWRAE